MMKTVIEALTSIDKNFSDLYIIQSNKIICFVLRKPLLLTEELKFYVVRGELNVIAIFTAHFVAVIIYFIIQLIKFYDICIIFYLDGNTCKRRGRQLMYRSFC